MVQTPAKTLNLEEFLRLPETKPASEYVDGQIIQKPMPKGKHSTIQTELASTLNRVLKSQQIAWAFSELRCTFAGKSIVPDVSVFTWARIPCDENGEISDTFLLAPDWTIEILSPEQSRTKVTKNILHCLKNQTQMGWLIDPNEQSVFVYLPNQLPEVFDQPETVIAVPQFASELQLSVRDLFGWLFK
ncbi:MAG: Uma2 family endonuclease [Sphaerospermopsis kisseleviana]